MAQHYLLIGQTVVPADDMPLEVWAQQAFGSDRRVMETYLPWCRVSTVFLALNHSFHDGPPDLFETMVFWGREGYEQERCSTWTQAEAQHRRVVEESCNPRLILTWLWRLARDQWREAVNDLKRCSGAVSRPVTLLDELKALSDLMRDDRF